MRKKILKRNSRKKIKKENININDIKKENIISLKQSIKENITDNRQQGKKIYKIWDIIITVFLAIIANANDWDDIVVFATENYTFLRKYLKMTGGIPCAKTYERVISSLNKEELEAVCLTFLFDVIKLKKKKMRDIINIDGKTDNGSARNVLNDNNEIEKIKSLNVLNAYSNQYGVCIASEMIENKTNEITAFPIIIKRFNIRNKIITVDALNSQKDNCKLIIKARGDYVMALKGNQGNFYKDVVDYFDDKKLKELAKNSNNYLKTTEKRGSEIITYEYYQTTDIDWYFDKKSWKGLKSIGLVKKTFDNPYEKKEPEYRYYISSLDLNISLFSTAIRSHWSVENKLHFYLDMTFRQDDNKTVDKEALFGLQIIKKMGLALLQPIKEKKKKSMNKIRLEIAYDVEGKMTEIFNFYAK